MSTLSKIADKIDKSRVFLGFCGENKIFGGTFIEFVRDDLANRTLIRSNSPKTLLTKMGFGIKSSLLCYHCDAKTYAKHVGKFEF